MYICKKCGHKKTDSDINLEEGVSIKVKGLYISPKTCPRCCERDTYIYINELENRTIKYKKSMGLIK